MYDTKEVLASIDQNAVYILLLCGAAMIFNYIFFIDAVRRALRDKVYPFSVFSTLFWLSGDASVVLSYDLAFHVLNHWYMKFFWGALCLTVMFELFFLSTILRFGRKEIAPELSQPQFVATILGTLVVTFFAYNFIKERMGDTLVIDYFCLANLAGPMFNWHLVSRRKNLAGTSPLIWICYTGVVTCWSTALMLFYGKPFASPEYLLIYALAFAGSLAVTFKVLKMSPARVAVAA
jgi:hypothetical protein